jgi:hypothetical protein
LTGNTNNDPEIVSAKTESYKMSTEVDMEAQLYMYMCNNRYKYVTSQEMHLLNNRYMDLRRGPIKYWHEAR